MKLKYLLAASAVSLSAAVILPAPVAAQQITTGIEGTVTDDAGNPLSGATVTVTDERTGATRTFTTGAAGTFSATGLVTGGPYTVSANAADYEGQTISNVQTTLQGNTSLTFALSSGGGVITVTAARVQLTQLAVGPGTSFTTETLENAPSFNRDVRDVIRLDPRVSLDRDDTGSGQDRISCLGGNDRGNAFTVDGISQGDIYGLNDTGFSSRSSTPIPYDAVRETEVQFAPFDVDYGNFTGCSINVVTKSGTNTFHGGAFFEYTNADLRGDHFDDPLRGTLPVAAIKPDKRWGVNLGGPVIPDHLFLFGAYEHQEAGQAQDEGPVGAGYANEITGITVEQFNEISQVLHDVYGLDTGPLVKNRPYKNDRYFVRADWQINDQHRLEATYQRLEESTTKADEVFTGSSPAVAGENTFYLSGTKSNYYSGRLYSQWTDDFSTELRYSRSEVKDLQDPIMGGEAQSGSPQFRILVGVDNAPLGSSPSTQAVPDGTVSAGPGSSRSANDLQTQVDQYRAVAKWESGAHTIKIGGEWNHASLYNLFVANATGTLVFRNIDDLRAGLLSPGTDANGTSTFPDRVVPGRTEGAFINRTVTGDINEAAAEFTRDIYSLFAQDDIQVTDQLKTVLGVRVDWYRGGHPELNPNFEARYGFPNTTGFNDLDPTIMPRLALSYDFDDFGVFSRAQLRAGAGVFSGGDPLVWFGNAFQNDGISFAQGTSEGGACGTGQIDVVDASGHFTGFPDCVKANASTSAARGTGFTQAIDPNIKQPTVFRLNLGFSSQLNFAPSGFFSGWDVNLDYIYSRYQNPFTVVDLSQTIDTRRGLNGYAIDGRPFYVTIDPTNPGCNATLEFANPRPTYSNVNFPQCVTTAREDEIMLTNSGGYTSHNASIILSKHFDGGLLTDGGSVFFTAGYAYQDAQDRRSMYNSTATSNYDYVAAFDRQNPAASRGFYSSTHNFTVSTTFAEEFFDNLETRLGISFIARSGRPYSLTWTGSGTFNDSASGSDNALVYLPTGVSDPNISPTSNMAAVQQLVDFASSLKCARDYLGQTIPRNTCSNKWYYDMDLTFSQELPGPGHFFGVDDKIKLFATVDNFLNLLDSGWNLQHRRDFAARQDIASTTGVDAQGRYIISNVGALTPNAATGWNSYQTDDFINTSSSVWRLKVGVSYNF